MACAATLKEALGRMNMPNIRFPGGKLVSGYRWMDGVGHREPSGRHDLLERDISNHFGTNEFIKFCPQNEIQPYCAPTRRRRYARGSRLGGIL